MAQSFNGPTQVHQKAIDLYSDHAKQLEQATIGSEHEGIVGAFYSRLSNYLLKFGLIYQAMMDHTQSGSDGFFCQVMSIPATEYRYCHGPYYLLT